MLEASVGALGAAWPGRDPPPHTASVISLFHMTAFLYSSYGIMNLGNCCQNCFSGERLRIFQYQGLRPVTRCSNSGCANRNSHEGLLIYLLLEICEEPEALHRSNSSLCSLLPLLVPLGPARPLPPAAVVGAAQLLKATQEPCHPVHCLPRAVPEVQVFNSRVIPRN